MAKRDVEDKPEIDCLAGKHDPALTQVHSAFGFKLAPCSFKLAPCKACLCLVVVAFPGE